MLTVNDGFKSKTQLLVTVCYPLYCHIAIVAIFNSRAINIKFSSLILFIAMSIIFIGIDEQFDVNLEILTN